MKKLVILTSMLCAYSTAHADASCCGTKRKQEDETPTAENAKKIKVTSSPSAPLCRSS